jgi:hypothetical protein
MPDEPLISNINPDGSAEFWFDGDVAQVIDNGVGSSFEDYIGSSDYWYQGTPTGYLQGGRGIEGESDPNLYVTPGTSTDPTQEAFALGTRAYAVILY